jgi:hypothetical protein
MIKQDDERNPGVVHEDYAAVWNVTWYDYGKSWAIVRVTIKALETHGFAGIVDFSGFEQDLLKLFFEGDVERCGAEILNMLGIDGFDELYVVRNSGDLAVFTFIRPDAGIICYGESYHKIDSCLGGEYSKIDLFRLFLPVDFTNGLLKTVPLDVTPKKYLLDVIREVLENDPDDKKRVVDLRERVKAGVTEGGGRSAVLALQYLSDIDAMSLNDEIALYVDAVKRACGRETRVVIKEHPRTLSPLKAERVRAALAGNGYGHVSVLDKELNHYPIEVICGVFRPDAVISPLSTSLLIVKYLYGIDGSMEMDDMSVRRSGVRYQYELHGVLKKAINNLDAWDPADNAPLAVYEGRTIFSLKNKDAGAKRLFESARGGPIPFTTEIMARWLKSLPSEAIIDMFKRLGFKSVALYGMGVIGKIIVDGLFESHNAGEMALCLIDADAARGSYRGLPIRRPAGEPGTDVEFDAIVCTVMHSYDVIVRDLLRGGFRGNMIYSFTELADIFLSEHELRARLL